MADPTAPRTPTAGASDRSGELSETDGSSHRSVTLVGQGRITVDLRAPIDARIDAIIAAQRGQVSRGQLLSCGVDDGAILRRVRNGRLVRVHHGVYRAPGSADVPLAVETAALLACGHGALLSHHSAITLWRLRPGIARPVHVTIPGDRGFPHPTGVRLHRSRRLAPRDLRVHDDMAITSPARSLLDVAATLPDRDVERLLDEALFARRLVTRAEIGELLGRAGKHAGRARLERVASGHVRSTRTDSPLEERLLALIRAGGLPEPQLQVPLLDYRLDFFWPELGLAVEADAYGTHGSPARFEGDRRRDARLLSERGIVVIRLTRTAIEERPFEAVGMIARAIGQREAPMRAA